MVLRRETSASFSDLWYRVAARTPCLSVHARVIRQQYGPEIAYIIEDPASGHYYRLTASAYFFLGMLDGRCTVEHAWQACCVQLGDDAPTQKECIDLLAKLQLYGLLVGADPLSADMLEERQRQARSERVARRTGKGLFWNVPLLNPERFLAATEHVWRAVYSRAMGIVWCLVVFGAIIGVLRHADELGSNLNSLLDPANLAIMGLLFLLIRIIHEFGHATACKAMGGRCTELGVIMIAGILPLPYCDATSAWRFPEVRKRVLVSAAGMMVEGFLASIAVFVWIFTEPGQLAHAIAFQAMVVSGVTTIIFNANPLLRYDGYYILSDLTGIPNLAMRARDLWKYFIQRFAFGVRGLAVPRIRDHAEFWTLTIYGALAPPYRLLVMFAIVMVVSSQFLTIGLVLAVILLVVVLVVPLVKAATYLLTSVTLMGRRSRALAISGGFIGLIVGCLGLWPVGAGAYASGVLEPSSRATLRTGEDGFLVRVHARPGDRVSKGQVLLEFENDFLRAELDALHAKRKHALLQRDRAAERNPAEREAHEARLMHLDEQIGRLQHRVSQLTIVAPFDGVLIAQGAPVLDLDFLVGRFLTRGTVLATLADLDRLEVTAALSDRDRAYVFRGEDDQIDMVPASLRVRGRAAKVIPAQAVHMAPVASRALTNPALSTDAGGDLLIDPSDPDRRRTIESFAAVRVLPAPDTDGLRAGQRVRVRFAAPAQPLAAQWWRRIASAIERRFSL
ncbi:MAG: PqqD family peptide modification chaperone [Phycisphaeraceae bacterium]|nr:PqqD family peptide modification chaperone [Phycisphaeraceae bacterium]MCW5753361.1 PqqD family peptide modification chaperone [Phycisphaeraceae bacterium]